MTQIHPTAIVDASAVIADDAVVGPYSVVGPNVSLASGVVLRSHVVVQQDTAIGTNTVIHPFALIGGDPQHLGYKGEQVRLEIGGNNIIREHATLNRGTPQGSGVTKLGNNCLLMTGAHIGHDCIVEDNVTMANNATLGGHAHIGSRTFLGGLCAVHQNARVGQGAIIGGLAAVTRDVIPYGSAWGNHARLRGLNLIGLKRKGYGKDQLRRLLAFYRELFEGEGQFAERLAMVGEAYGDLPEIVEILDFIRDVAKRPLCLPSAE